MNTIAPKTENTDPNPHVVKLGAEIKRNLVLLNTAKQYHDDWERSKRILPWIMVIAMGIELLCGIGYIILYVSFMSFDYFTQRWLVEQGFTNITFVSICTAIAALLSAWYYCGFGISVYEVTGKQSYLLPWEVAVRRIADARGTHLRMLMASIADYQSELFVHGPNEERRERLQAFADMLEDDFTRNGPIGSPGTDVPVHLPDDIVAVIDSFASRALDRRLRTKAMIEVNQVGSESKKRS